MEALQPLNPDYEAAIRESFERQTLMATLGARLVAVVPGRVEIALDFSPGLAQQHGFLHAGALVSIADSACGYAAQSMAPRDHEVLAVELKMNFLRPAEHDRFLAIGRVLRPGRSLSACAADVMGYRSGKEILVATMLSTIAVRRADRDTV